MSESMIELMARALCVAMRDADPDKVTAGAPEWTFWVPCCRAVVTALESAGYVIVSREPTEAMIARAIKDCTDKFTNPAAFYIEPEARHCWEQAHPEHMKLDGPDWYDQPESNDELASYKIIARAVLAMISAAKETP